METNPSSTSEAANLAREQLLKEKYRIPDIYLIPCKWFKPYVEGNIQENIQIEEQNMLSARECYIRHNTLIEYYKKIDD